MANIEVHSQESGKRLKKYLAQFPIAKDLVVTEVADACTDALTGTNQPFLRLWVTPDDPLEEILDVLEHYVGIHQLDIEVAPLLRFVPKNPQYAGHLP